MATIYVDNIPYEVKDGQNLLNACLSLGFNLPYFCWHPVMHSVGACRQCAVKMFRDENDTRGRLVMACMTPVAEGARISIDDPDAKAFRASIIEWLMESHPHDCPVCDEGSECHLQDMTLMTGHSYRRYRFQKRTNRNQDLGPFVYHEMNRCIQCYRCVRYYRDYAGGRDLNVFGAHDRLYFGREEDGTLESEFSGNLVEVCPTGVFTDKTQRRHYSRKWDLQTAPSVCVHCSLGCNTFPAERYGELSRVRNRFNIEVNGYFLCDRGRYGYEFVNSPLRLREPVVRGVATPPETDAAPDPRGTALERLGAILSAGGRAIGIGSPRASLESNFALRSLVGPENFFSGMSDRENQLVAQAIQIATAGPAPAASLAEVRSSDAVLLLGEDVTSTAPVLALALRQASRQEPMKTTDRMKIPRWHDSSVREVIQQDKGPFFIASVAPTRLGDIATTAHLAAPDDIARLGFAVAEAIAAIANPPEGLLDRAREAAVAARQAIPVGDADRQIRETAEAAARALMAADNPLVVTGVNLGSEAVLQAAAAVAWALREAGKSARIAIAYPECNSVGLSLMGPVRLGAAIEAVRAGGVDTVVVLENDLSRRAPQSDVADLVSGSTHLVVLDTLESELSESAEVSLPVASFAEGGGTLVNNEGRAQRFYQVFPATGWVTESWRWIRDAMAAAGRLDARSWLNLDGVIGAMVAALPQLAPVAEITPPASFRIAGQKVARQHARATGRTAMNAHIDVSEPMPPEDPDSPLAFSMEGIQGFEKMPPSTLMARIWAPNWNSEQALNKFQAEVGGPLKTSTPGQRLVGPTSGEARPELMGAPEPFRPRDGELLLVAVHHTFGSEEQSIHAPGIAELAPAPYLALRPEEAERLGLRQGEELAVTLGGVERRLVVRTVPGLPEGVACVPAGIPQLKGLDLPVWSRFGGQGR
ncbi:MAG TPA: NADH-quinone oxidoreductase subunit NuoG [Chloroflexota bacterium]|nr:NADH-quinone oxidoreductase subunit NuoG [Chloroflexota bacterium]